MHTLYHESDGGSSNEISSPGQAHLGSQISRNTHFHLARVKGIIECGEKQKGWNT